MGGKKRNKNGLRCRKCGSPLYVDKTISLYSGEKVVRVYHPCPGCGTKGYTSTDALDLPSETVRGVPA